MNKKTLVDIFPRVAPPSHRNFIKENVLGIRNMRCTPNKRIKINTKELKNQPARSTPNVEQPKRPKQTVRHSVIRRSVSQTINSVETCDRGIQTESTGDLPQVTSNQERSITDQLVPTEDLGRSEKTCERRNRNIPTSTNVVTSSRSKKSKVPGGRPAPKISEGASTTNNANLNRLVKPTNEEHTDTLRLLKESYQVKIKEMNSLPVRNDTLKIQRRKMELEEELKKIDNNIKLLQRGQAFIMKDKL